MQSKAKTVAEYLRSLPEDRRSALSAVRGTILANLDKGFEEGMQYGMIGYYVPHSAYPPGYHCDPKQPLPFAGLASQKNHMSLYVGCLYGGDGRGGEAPELAWLQKAWAKTGKKLDMGKACIRFKKLEDLPLDLIGELFRRLTAKAYVERYEGERARHAASKGKSVGAGKGRTGATAPESAAKKKASTQAPARERATSQRARAKSAPQQSASGKAAKKTTPRRPSKKAAR